MPRSWISIIILVLISLGLILSCSQPIESPRERVLDFARLMQADSLPDIYPYVDVDSLALYLYNSEEYDSLSVEEKKTRLLWAFVRDGEYRRKFTRSQIVINREQFLDDTTAVVEVSYIDRKTRIQYYTQMRLKRRDGVWIICDLQSE